MHCINMCICICICIYTFQSFPNFFPRYSGNFVKTLKIRVKLVLNSPWSYAITYPLYGFSLAQLVYINQSMATLTITCVIWTKSWIISQSSSLLSTCDVTSLFIFPLLMKKWFSAVTFPFKEKTLGSRLMENSRSKKICLYKKLRERLM